MIGTIRKHSKWLLWLIAGLTIFSFVYFMISGPTRMGGGSSGRAVVDTNLVSGRIYGQKVTMDDYERLRRDVNLYFLFNYGVWADQDPNVSPQALQQEIYIRLMMYLKAKALGIHVNDEQVAQAAAAELRSPQLLRALGQSRQSNVPYSVFVNQVLAPHGLTANDFENYVRDDLALNQLQLTYGLPGLLITPQEATVEYMRQYQEMSAQIVFFSASNYLSHVSISPQDVGLYYTNYMANYRVPDRVQVSFVEFYASNYLGQAEKELTNLDTQVTSIFTQYGMQVTPDAKTPDQAKAEIRKELIQRQALGDAAQQAGDFAQVVFNVSNSANQPASASDLYSVARQKGLRVQTPAPFSAEYGPEDFAAPAAFTRQAFELSTNSPLAEPIPGSDGVYVMALLTNLPSEIPPLDQIHNKVRSDMQLQEATIMAQRAGTNFQVKLYIQMAVGKNFTAACVALGAEPQMLPPFSLSTQDMPELDGRATLNQVKQAVVSTAPGMASGFIPTDDGGFLLCVQSRMPIDQAKMATDLPQFTAELRQQRQSQTFNDWYLREANRQLRDTPVARQK
jgi:SurA N-terminal domain